MPATLPYATDSSRLDAYLVSEPVRREKVADKVDQLIRNGLATTHLDGPLIPLVCKKVPHCRGQTHQQLRVRVVWRRGRRPKGES